MHSMDWFYIFREIDWMTCSFSNFYYPVTLWGTLPYCLENRKYYNNYYLCDVEFLFYFYKTGNGKWTMTDKSTQCQVKWSIYIAQSNTAQRHPCWVPLFNQLSQPFCKEKAVNNTSLSIPMASVYFHSWQCAKLDKKEMYTVTEYRRGSLVFQRSSDKFIHSHKLIWELFIIYSRAILCTSVEATNKHVLKEENDLSPSHSGSASTFSPLSLTQD